MKENKKPIVIDWKELFDAYVDALVSKKTAKLNKMKKNRNKK